MDSKTTKKLYVTWKFWYTQSFTESIAKVVAVFRQEVIRVSRPLSAKFPQYVTYFQDRTVCLSQKDMLTIFIHRIFTRWTTKNSGTIFTKPKWPFFFSIYLSKQIPTEIKHWYWKPEDFYLLLNYQIIFKWDMKSSSDHVSLLVGTMSGIFERFC